MLSRRFLLSWFVGIVAGDFLDRRQARSESVSHGEMVDVEFEAVEISPILGYRRFIVGSRVLITYEDGSSESVDDAINRLTYDEASQRWKLTP